MTNSSESEIGPRVAWPTHRYPSQHHLSRETVSDSIRVLCCHLSHLKCHSEAGLACRKCCSSGNSLRLLDCWAFGVNAAQRDAESASESFRNCRASHWAQRKAVQRDILDNAEFFILWMKIFFCVPTKKFQCFFLPVQPLNKTTQRSSLDKSL